MVATDHHHDHHHHHHHLLSYRDFKSHHYIFNLREQNLFSGISIRPWRIKLRWNFPVAQCDPGRRFSSYPHSEALDDVTASWRLAVGCPAASGRPPEDATTQRPSQRRSQSHWARGYTVPACSRLLQKQRGQSFEIPFPMVPPIPRHTPENTVIKTNGGQTPAHQPAFPICPLMVCKGH